MQFHLGINVKSPARKPLDRAHLRIRNALRNLAPCIGKKLKRARRSHAWVNLPKRACCGVTRIFIGLFSPRNLRRIHSFKISVININLAANLNDCGPIFTRKRLWNGAERGEIGGDILSNFPIPARRAADELAVFITQRRREAINFRLCGKAHGRVIWQA